MAETLIWWILLELIGLAAFPVAFRFFRNLPGRGYAFVKPLGLLLVAYPFWLLTSFGFLDNTQGGIAMVLLVAAALSWGLLGRKQGEPAVGRHPGLGEATAVSERVLVPEPAPVSEPAETVRD